MTTAFVAAGTHRGRVRIRNEDVIAFAGLFGCGPDAPPVELSVPLDGPLTCLVADGLGGHAEGQRASRLAAQVLMDAGVELGGADPIRAAVRAANAAIYREMDLVDGSRGMGSTVAGLVVTETTTWCFNVGDSRCYQLCDGSLAQLTVDDAPPPMPGQPADAPTTVVTSTLGGRAEHIEVDPRIEERPTVAGARYLLCSDGLTDLVDLDSLEKVLATRPFGRELVNDLVTVALERGGTDNVSVVLIEIGDRGDR